MKRKKFNFNSFSSNQIKTHFTNKFRIPEPTQKLLPLNNFNETLKGKYEEIPRSKDNFNFNNHSSPSKEASDDQNFQMNTDIKEDISEGDMHHEKNFSDQIFSMNTDTSNQKFQMNKDTSNQKFQMNKDSDQTFSMNKDTSNQTFSINKDSDKTFSMNDASGKCNKCGHKVWTKTIKPSTGNTKLYCFKCNT